MVRASVFFGMLLWAGITHADEFSGCKLKHPALETTWPLRTTQNAPVFANTNPSRGVAVSVTLPLGDARQGAQATLADDNIEMTTFVVDERVGYLGPARPIRFGRSVVAGQGARLWWRATGTDGRVSVEAMPMPQYTTRGPLMAQVGCNEIVLGQTKVTGVRAAVGVAEQGTRVDLARDVDIPLSVEAAGDPEGVLRFGARDVVSIEKVDQDEDGAFFRLWITIDGLSVYGWVPSIVVKPNPAGVAFGGLGGRRSGEGVALRECDRALALSVRQGANVTRIGQIKVRGKIAVSEPGFDWTSVAVPTSRWLALAPGAQLVVRSEELPACKVMAPAKR